jgi:hypothetical protein
MITLSGEGGTIMGFSRFTSKLESRQLTFSPIDGSPRAFGGDYHWNPNVSLLSLGMDSLVLDDFS